MDVLLSTKTILSGFIFLNLNFYKVENIFKLQIVLKIIEQNREKKINTVILQFFCIYMEEG